MSTVLGFGLSLSLFGAHMPCVPDTRAVLSQPEEEDAVRLLFNNCLVSTGASGLSTKATNRVLIVMFPRLGLGLELEGQQDVHENSL